MGTTEIDGIKYNLVRPKLKDSISGLNFIVQYYGKGLVSIILASADPEIEATPESFDSLIDSFKDNEDLLNTTFDFFLNDKFVRAENGVFDKEDVYQKKGLSHLLKIISEIVKYNYAHFFLSKNEKN